MSQNKGLISEPRFSCALSAQQTVLAIPHAIPIVHAGPGCSSKTSWFMTSGAGFQGDGYAGGNNVPSTNMIERDVVFGGERKLSAEVEGALKVMRGDLFVILAGCTSGIIGDDPKKIAREWREQGFPVVGAETSGFRGNTYFGHEEVIGSIIDQLLDGAQPQVERGLVNVFASVPNIDVFWRNDLENLKALLEKLGLRVNILFGWSSGGIDEWKSIPNAQANLVVSPWVGVQAARKLEEKFGTPWLHEPVFPVGGRATSAFLRRVGEFLGLDAGAVEAVIAHEEKRYYDYFINLSNFFSDMYNNIPHEAYVVSDAHYGLGLADFLVHDMGFSLEHMSLTCNPAGESETLVLDALASLGPDIAAATTLDIDGYEIRTAMEPKLKRGGNALILGSTWECHLAKEYNATLLHVSLPINDDVIVTRGYFGYDGGLRLAEDIYAGVFRKGNITYMTQSS